jgi:hypothetical protein
MTHAHHVGRTLASAEGGAQPTEGIHARIEGALTASCTA